MANQKQKVFTFGCLDEGVDEDEDGLVGDPESFLTFLSLRGGESGPFSTLGELASLKKYKVLKLIRNDYIFHKERPQQTGESF